MRKHRIKVRYVFDGHYDIRAENEQDARRIAERDCGLVMGGSIHTSNDEQVVDWDFNMHPTVELMPVKSKK